MGYYNPYEGLFVLRGNVPSMKGLGFRALGLGCRGDLALGKGALGFCFFLAFAVVGARSLQSSSGFGFSMGPVEVPRFSAIKKQRPRNPRKACQLKARWRRKTSLQLKSPKSTSRTKAPSPKPSHQAPTSLEQQLPHLQALRSL